MNLVPACKFKFKEGFINWTKIKIWTNKFLRAAEWEMDYLAAYMNRPFGKS